ncbi:hypothetical protein N7452_005370 [Penicillium brevicompactum]|uniref:Uncharacterized protein n=1 Tax=Penicillium brevicompactum TaxID=5074 RepID=A0A9W9QIH6_PENBR|nr:hypothetical protein N7452_005370 [Penicillium brevicompactum]
MESYLSLPIIDQSIAFLDETSSYEDNMKALIFVLNHEFPLTMGYGVAPKQNDNTSHPDFVVYRLQRRSTRDRGLFDHTLAQAKRSDGSLEDTISQLVTALESAYSEHGRCWAIMAIGTTLHFYEYHTHLPANHRLIPWCPPGHSTNIFHLRDDSRVIESMFDHLRQNNEPAAR